MTTPNSTTQIHPPKVEASETSGGGSAGGGICSTSSSILEGKTIPSKGRMVVGDLRESGYNLEKKRDWRLFTICRANHFCFTSRYYM